MLNYKVIGNGFPVVFLHGFLESISMWEKLDMELFPFQSVCIDLPGHGNSLNEDDKEPSLDFMAEKVSEVLNHLKIKAFAIVGHSMGGYVAMLLKKKFPTLENHQEINGCIKVVLLNSNFWEDSEVKKNDRLRVAEIVFKNKTLFVQTAVPNLFVKPENFQGEIKELIKEALKIDEHGIAYASLAMRNRKDTKEILTKSVRDFLIIQGELDTIVPIEMMKEELKDSRVKLEIIGGVGHMAHIEAPCEVQKLLLDFINDKTEVMVNFHCH